jgi:hypothetical protein
MLSLNKLSLISLLMTLSLSTNASETNTSNNKPGQCHDLIQACDKAIQAKDNQIRLRDKVIDLKSTENKALLDQVKAKEGQLSNPLRQPVVLTGAGVIGTLLGGPAVGIGLIVISSLFLK